MLEKVSINITQQSTLAKLLAKENIQVIHGVYKTAWFDPAKRILALPIWKNKGKPVYDLLTGHEVGHALYTPAIGWHDAVEDVNGAPKAYLNVLEDVRIERKVQDRYPGLRAQFQKAYKQLAEEDFFGIIQNHIDIDSSRLIDKINVKSKLGNNIDVQFDDIELGFYAASFKTESFEDVVELAKKIYEYQKALEAAAPQQQTKQTLPQVDDLENSFDDDSYEKPDDEKSEAEQENNTNPDTEEDMKGPSGKGHNKDGQDALDKDDIVDGPGQKSTQDEELKESITDKAFRDREKELLANDDLKDTMVYTINKVRQPNVVIEYKEYYKQWEEYIASHEEYEREYINDSRTTLKDKFTKFKNDTEMAAAYMAKEFELRKAAYQYSRSSVQKTGIINTNKLHAYKYSEDIFLKSTKLANYKNHGMMMFIDFSGSMQENIGPTIRQLLNLTLFCRMVQIPYEVYAFTTRVRDDQDDRNQRYEDFTDCEIIPEKFNLLNLMSSRMTRAEYQKAQDMLWHLSVAWEGQMSQCWINPWNQLHSTPLNTCIIVANDMIKEYKLKHNIENMTAMFLSDGDSDNFQIRMTEDGDKHRVTSGHVYYRGRKAIVRIDGKALHVNSVGGHDMTEKLFKFLKESAGTNVLGFFISQYRNQAINKIMGEVIKNGEYTKYKDKYTAQMNKNRCLIEDNVFGYDRYFGLCTKYMDIVEDEFGELVEDGASKSKIKSAFTKMTKAKRVNRILLNAFVDAIA